MKTWKHNIVDNWGNDISFRKRCSEHWFLIWNKKFNYDSDAGFLSAPPLNSQQGWSFYSCRRDHVSEQLRDPFGPAEPQHSNYLRVGTVARPGVSKWVALWCPHRSKLHPSPAARPGARVPVTLELQRKCYGVPLVPPSTVRQTVACQQLSWPRALTHGAATHPWNGWKVVKIENFTERWKSLSVERKAGGDKKVRLSFP